MNSEDTKRAFSLKNLPWIWIVLCIIFSVGGLIITQRYGSEMPSMIDKTEREVTLYFVSEDGKSLSEEKGFIKRGTTKLETGSIIEKLFKGPGFELGRTIPIGTRLYSVKIKGEVAIIDFSGHLKTRHWGGSTAELLTIYSIVNSVTANIKEIKAVQILIEGERFKTLGGHIMINRPISPKTDMIKG